MWLRPLLPAPAAPPLQSNGVSAQGSELPRRRDRTGRGIAGDLLPLSNRNLYVGKRLNGDEPEQPFAKQARQAVAAQASTSCFSVVTRHDGNATFYSSQAVRSVI
jgi:hypothetical protein